jgi:cell fate regulator YaaT (PSP1 superfamily)
MPECIGVKFDNGPKLHYMEAPPAAPDVGTRCVVSTRRGLEVGIVRTFVRDHPKPGGHYVRDALPDDVERYEALRQRAEELKWLLRARARQHGSQAKIVSLEFTIDESLLVVSYSSEEQAPLRLMAQELLSHSGARIEFNNVGPRDQARILGTLGACGGGSCSSTWLQSFNAVSIRMARDQQLPLNPEKISGPCGRLMCCLQYEHDMYRELLKGMPKKGVKACHTATGHCGRVMKLNPLKRTVELKTDEDGIGEYPVDEIERVRGSN